MRYSPILLCLAFATSMDALAVADEWPQWRGPNRDGVWNENGVVERFSQDRLDIRWRVPISGDPHGSQWGQDLDVQRAG